MDQWKSTVLIHMFGGSVRLDQKVHLLSLEGREQEMCGECGELSGSEGVMGAVVTIGC